MPTILTFGYIVHTIIHSAHAVHCLRHRQIRQWHPNKSLHCDVMMHKPMLQETKNCVISVIIVRSKLKNRLIYFAIRW